MEVERYISRPGQALLYKIGMLKIQELRAKAKSQLGDSFDIRDFHDEVLRNGAVPLPIPERVVERYIRGQELRIRSMVVRGLLLTERLC